MKKISLAALLFAFILVSFGCSVLSRLTGSMPAIATVEPDKVGQVDTKKPAATNTPMPKPVAKCTKASVVYDSGVVTVTGLDASDGTVWSRDFTIPEETELSRYSQATVADGVLYLQIDYHMLALYCISGETIWISQYSGCLCKPVVVDGKVYTSSYNGSPLVALSKVDGSTLFDVSQVDENFQGPNKVEAEGENLVVYFSKSGEENKIGKAVFDLLGNLISHEAE